MSLESILNRILNDANAQREKIIQEALQEANRIIQEAKLEAEGLYNTGIQKEKALYESQKQRLIVNARLEYKKNLLKAKQELIDAVFEKLKPNLRKDKFKKQRIFQDKVQEVPEDINFYLDKVRLDYETDISRILFS